MDWIDRASVLFSLQDHHEKLQQVARSVGATGMPGAHSLSWGRNVLWIVTPSMGPQNWFPGDSEVLLGQGSRATPVELCSVTRRCSAVQPL